MDLVNYDQKKFEEIEGTLAKFIQKIGFSKDKIYFVPISAYMKDNLITKSDKMKWYSGKPLIDLLYINAKLGDTKAGKDLRVVLQGFLDGENKVVAGKIVSGVMKVGARSRLSFGL